MKLAKSVFIADVVTLSKAEEQMVEGNLDQLLQVLSERMDGTLIRDDDLMIARHPVRSSLWLVAGNIVPNPKPESNPEAENAE